MKKTALLVLFIVLSKSSMWAQTADNTENPNHPRNPIKKTGNVEVVAITSEYNNMDNKIKSMTLDGTIPQDFPKYSTGTTKEKYDAIVDIWIKNNSAKVKPEYRKNSLTTDK